MKVSFLDLKRQQAEIKEKLLTTTSNIIEEGWYIGGKHVTQFEHAFSGYLKAENCISCANGTDALELILKGFGIGKGDEVIVPSFTWVSDAEVVHAVGARPVFADIPMDSYCISGETIANLITSKTKAIIVVHLYGIPCHMDPIINLGKEYGIKVIEDCAQAHGASYMGKKVGTIGDAAAFSFYPTKNLGALGDGGAIITNDATLAQTVRLLKDHGQKARDEHVAIGENSRLDALQAAVLSLKLSYLDQWNDERRRLAQIYLSGMNKLDMKLPDNGIDRVFHLFVIQTALRNQLRKYLSEHGIETAIHYPVPIHKIEAYQVSEVLPNSERAAGEVLSLPLYPGMEDAEVEYILDHVKAFMSTGK
ncbi:DegT/DnrJ/EryC1/StrS family aminotransferase [Fulvivirga ulvae]|uniref:DegT/DnrJ/EryC1/StrS family aminotransferase n=1 Tax=Fulvivirga ulvae TaxID=2904245 RepID=UPI001F1721C0|nr:DegT/DnrJ/EryC1/StrS family aminotransferase [Fulvivirga ulvae]UII30197.1 DegT/DnrJ/EryC1/StrS family aminotransferase [Fulvivirga ulvae]